jgi:hypothetical protein
MAIKYIVSFVETPRKFITAKLSIRKPGHRVDKTKVGTLVTSLYVSTLWPGSSSVLINM